MRQRDDRRRVLVEPPADALLERHRAEEARDREASHRDDEGRPDQLELPLRPERAEVALAWRRDTVAAAGRGPSGVAPRDGRAMERLEERPPRHAEPRAERVSGSALPRQPRAPFLDAWCLP